ncbi:response regulator [Clostridium beijerinckii]|uniref:response regulator n=1 Tax=Clostridium beijerinckii TaxID=1520 RepID=UPI00047E3D94|nr:response regulator [Clostridium beijerinckii]
MKIIVVDDDKIIRIGLSKIIKRLFDEHEVVNEFQNGLAALQYLKENEEEVNLVITDIKMPVMTGIELIEKAKRELNKPPLFVVLSGYDEFNYVRDTMKAGAINYLLKPIKQEDLKNIMQEAETKIKDNEKNHRLLNKSIEVLKKDFFKYILFTNKEIDFKTNELLLENMQLNEGYIYKMVIVQRKEDDTNIFKEFMSCILTAYNKIEYEAFSLEDCIYTIFYFDKKQYENIDLINEKIESETEVFVNNSRNVYILRYTDKVWKLRENYKLVKKLKENMCYDNSSKKYFVNESDKLLETLNSESNNPNVVVISLAKQYIINNFNKNITLKDVANEVLLSQNYLSELFKKEVGEGFYDFLSSYRIKKAKELLLTTNLKIYEIGQKVGYNDSITFGRAFKKIAGTTPNNFRNNKEND